MTTPPTPPAAPTHAFAILDCRMAKATGVASSDLTAALDRALELKYPTPEDTEHYWKYQAYIRDVFDDAVVYTYQCQLLRIGYTYADGQATLTGEPEAVLQNYVPAGAQATPSVPDTSVARAAAKAASDAVGALKKLTSPAKAAL